MANDSAPSERRSRDDRRGGQRALITAVVAAALVLGPAACLAATTYYVRATGNDAADGLSPATALASVRPAARRLREPGDRLVVGPGVYREGNIAPFGNGTPDAPIVLLGDPTGTLTEDARGPVVVLPPNAKDSTTGIIVYGRNDIVIQGFEIAGAADAGIQVRRRRRTGVDSTRIAILDNTVRASRKGIQVTAVGEVTVAGNQLSRNGVMLAAGVTGSLTPLVRDNVILQSDYGVGVEGTVGGTIAQNEIQSLIRALFVVNADGLRIVGNQFHGPGNVGKIYGRDLEIADNAGDGRGMIWANDQLTLTRNSLAGNLLIRGDTGRATLTDNSVHGLYVSGIAELDLERNAGQSLTVKGTGIVTAADNRIESMEMEAGETLEATGNEGRDLVARGPTVIVRSNDLDGNVWIAGRSATVSGNTADVVSVKGRARPAPDDGDGHGVFLVESNVTRRLLRVAQADSAVVQDNTVGGMLKASVGRDLYVARNGAHGIAAVLSEPDSQVLLSQNGSHDSAGPGLLVIGAGSAIVENNLSADNADSGLAARHTRRLTVTGNAFLGNPSGGISVLLPLAGDCNDDLDVRIDDLLTAVGIALGRRPLQDCAAADTDGNGAVTVDEIVVSVKAALDPPGASNTSVVLRGNRVENNGRFGIDLWAIGSVEAVGNRVLSNGGIPLAMHGRGLPDHSEVIDNLLGLGGAEGLLIDGFGGARLRNNVVVSNREAGVLLRDAPGAMVTNNLIYANGSHGIAVGVDAARPAVGAVLMNNTLYANGKWGIAIGGPGAASTGVVIRDNILQHNAHGGITAVPSSLAGLAIGFNVNDDGYDDGVLPAATDITADPGFVAPAGSDGVLGGEGLADDDFHLEAASPAIDAGSAPAAELGITGSAVAGLAGDVGVVDIGYHYGAADDL